MALTYTQKGSRKNAPRVLPDIASAMAEVDRKIADLVEEVNQTRAASIEADRTARISDGRLEELEIGRLIPGQGTTEQDVVRAREEARSNNETAQRLRHELTDKLTTLERIERLRPRLLREAQERIMPELKRIYREALEAIEQPALMLQFAVEEAMRVREHILTLEIRHFHPHPVNVFGLPVPFSEFLAGANTGTSKGRIAEFVKDLQASGL